MPELNDDVRQRIAAVADGLAASQARLATQAIEQLAEADLQEVILPRTLCHRIDETGASSIERIGSVRRTLSSLVPPGAFQITRAKVGIPLGPSDGRSDDDRRGELELEFEYVPLVDLPRPIDLERTPDVEVVFTGFEPLRRRPGWGEASGRVSVTDAETGAPLAGERVLLDTDAGTVRPSAVELDERGNAEFVLHTRLASGRRLETTIGVLVRGVSRRLQVRLELDDLTP